MEKKETATAVLWIGEDDVLRAVFKEDSIETLDHARENVEAASALIGDRKVPVLIDMSAIKEISRDARSLYASDKPASYSIAQALITRSPISKVIGNFFLGLNKPLHAVKLFTSEEDALAWLKKKTEEAASEAPQSS